jgi:putative nucleotidyltransferase with HDIG domain
MTETTLPPLDVEVLVRKIGKLPASSEVILELLRVIDADEIGATALAEIISRDQAIVVRLLRIANSSFYALPGQVESITDAIAILGWRQVRTLEAGVAIFRNFRDVKTPGFDFNQFWQHSVAVAVATRELALRMKLGEGGAFVAGLIHDIGRIAVAHSFPEHAQAVACYQETHTCPVAEAERAVLGIDHAHIGGALAERWHFPSAICNAIAAHHATEDTLAAHLDPLALAVCLANALAHCRSDHEEPQTQRQCVSHLPWEKASLVERDGEKVLAAIEREQEFLCGMLIDNAASEK